MTELQALGDLFNSTEKRQAFTDLDGMLWINADILCKELGFRNTSQTVAGYTDEDERCKINTGGLVDSWFVSEPGVWALILASKSDRSKQFKRTLTRSILPNIRKNGYYIDPNATAPQLKELAKEIQHHKNWSREEFLACLEEDQSDRRLDWEDF